MKPVWFIIGQLMCVLWLAACAGTVSTTGRAEAPTETPTAVQMATTASIDKPTALTTPADAGPRAGSTAPDFTLPASNGTPVHLADVLKANRATVLVFYLDAT